MSTKRPKAEGDPPLFLVWYYAGWIDDLCHMATVNNRPDAEFICDAHDIEKSQYYEMGGQCGSRDSEEPDYLITRYVAPENLSTLLENRRKDGDTARFQLQSLEEIIGECPKKLIKSFRKEFKLSILSVAAPDDELLVIGAPSDTTKISGPVDEKDGIGDWRFYAQDEVIEDQEDQDTFDAEVAKALKCSVEHYLTTRARLFRQPRTH